MPAKSKSGEIRIIRMYDAPVQAVWDAWVDPAQTAQWWGPRGFTLTTHSKDLRPGGTWIYTMHGPDGTDYPNKTQYLEVEPGARLVYDHGGNDDRPPLFRVTVLFSESRGRTKMDMTMTLPTPEDADTTRVYIKKAGGDATWDRLGEHLEKRGSGREIFVINRSFDAPRDVMFDMWTKPEHISRWLAPTGLSMQFIRADIRPGATSFYVMTGNGMTLHGRIAYLKIEKPDTIVYTQQFCDEHENISRHPMAPVWPETMLTKVTFHEEGPDRTRVAVEWEPQAPVSAEELAAFVRAKPGMTGGWTGSFDKLEACLTHR
ncbi:MAG: SRPBCC family protein [Bdellovibrionales bacterium]